jgi:hypothetical protein
MADRASLSQICIYWLYEEVTVNAICLSQQNEKVFLSAEPALVYNDFNDLDNIEKGWKP